MHELACGWETMTVSSLAYHLVNRWEPGMVCLLLHSSSLASLLCGMRCQHKCMLAHNHICTHDLQQYIHHLRHHRMHGFAQMSTGALLVHELVQKSALWWENCWENSWENDWVNRWENGWENGWENSLEPELVCLSLHSSSLSSPLCGMHCQHRCTLHHNHICIHDLQQYIHHLRHHHMHGFAQIYRDALLVH